MVLVLFTIGCAKRFPVRGMVVGTDASAGTALISHGDIRRYMPAMTMPFRVRKPAELAGLSPGAQVEFDLVIRRSGSHIGRSSREALADRPSARW